MRKFIGILLLAIRPLQASVGTEGASFLDIPVGAGPTAMGSAYTALATNVYAPNYNPGGLGFLKGSELAGQHLSYVQSIRYEHFGFVMPLSSRDSTVHRGIGLSIQDVGTGDISRTDVSGGQPVTGLGSYSSHWGAYNLSYGQTVTQRLALGLTGKLIHASIDGVSASAYAFDAGGLYRCSDRLSLAATVTNVGTPLKFLNEGNSLPMAIRAGAAYRPNERWTFSTEGIYRKTGLASLNIGSQWQPLEAVALRVGYKTETLKELDALAGFTTGIGIQLWNQELAYAWAPYGELGSAQYLTFIMRFGGAADSKSNLIQAPTPKEPRVAMRWEP